MGTHNHTLRAKAAAADTDQTGKVPSPSVSVAEPQAAQASGGPKPVNIYSRNAQGKPMMGAAIGMEGGGQPHENRQPFQVVSFCIATDGIYPSPT
jgi:microcystin-dependent protein